MPSSLISGQGLSPAAMRTYQISAPLASHTVEISCKEASCEYMERGWTTGLDESQPMGAKQASWIRAMCRPDGKPAPPGVRRYVESKSPSGQTLFAFPAGQECFRKHRRRTSREELFIVRGGTHSTSTGWRKQHVHPEDWVEDLQENQDRLLTIVERG